MGTDAFDVLQRRSFAEQVLLNAKFNLTGDLEWRGQKHIQRVVYRAFGRVFDRNHTEICHAAFNFLERSRQSYEMAMPGQSGRNV